MDISDLSGLKPHEGSKRIMTSIESSFPVLYFTEHWVKQELAPLDESTCSPGQYLIMSQDKSLFHSIQAHLKDGDRAILVRTGPGFKAVNDHTFDINPSERSDFVELIEALRKKNLSINRIIFNWPELAIAHGPLPLVFLSQALLGTKNRDPIQLIYLHSVNGDSDLSYQRASAGFMRSLRAETPHLIFKYLEITNLDSLDLAPSILSEFCSDSKHSVEVILNAGERHTRQLKSVEGNESGQESQLLRRKGVYLITGGAGGLGLVFAKFLQNKFDAQVILVGRKSEFSDAGPGIEYLQCDVTNESDVARIRDTILGQFGRINGILHAAGVIHSSRTANKSAAEIRAVLSPKIDGINQIFGAFKACQLDFLVLFSSISSVLGTVGLCDYAFANAYLDSFAKTHASQSHIRKVMAVNWPLWDCGGMQADERTRRILFFMSGMVPLTAQAGLNAFERALAFADNQLIVAQGDPERLHATLGVAQPPSKS